MKLRKELKRLRHRCGWTQEDLAVMSRLTTSAVSKLESGERFKPAAATLSKICDALRLSNAESRRLFRSTHRGLI